MPRVLLLLLAAAVAGQLSLVEKAPDTLEMCVGANCTTVAFLPTIIPTSFQLHRSACAATIVVTYRHEAALRYVTHTVSENGACTDSPVSLAV